MFKIRTEDDINVLSINKYTCLAPVYQRARRSRRRLPKHYPLGNIFNSKKFIKNQE